MTTRWIPPLWCYEPLLSPEREANLRAILNGEKREDTDVDPVLAHVRELCVALSAHSQSVWLASISLDPWPETTEVASTRPPFRYSVLLDLVHNGEVTTQIRLSPIEMRLITELDPDLGRRIGDELDGQLPRPEA